jgi:2-polyprenyl-3-methyl-5-hydroxy-6-metoxy-1,4-benzoquinol methylase
LGSVRGSRPAEPDRWNHNIHYHSVILRAVPEACGRALDVGCGEGVLARELANVSASVTAIDLDGASLEVARRQPSPGVDYVHGDVLTYPFKQASFDFVASVAALHHMGSAAGLERMRELLRPGGTLAVVGLARSRYPRDLPLDIAGAISTRFHRLTKTYWEHSAPIVWPPPETHAQTREVAERTLPGVRYRRRILWRYSLTWVNRPS